MFSVPNPGALEGKKVAGRVGFLLRLCVYGLIGASIAGSAFAAQKPEPLKGVAKSVESFTDEDMFAEATPAPDKAAERFNFAGWISHQYTNNRFYDTIERMRLHTNITTVAGGVMIDKTFILGAAYTKYLTTGTSRWRADSDTDIDQDGNFGALHGSYLINRQFSISATPIYGLVKYSDETRNRTNNQRSSGDQDIWVFSLPIALTFGDNVGNFDYGAKLGYNWMRLEEEAYTETNGTRFNHDYVYSRIVRAGLRAGYRFGDFRPNAFVDYERELNPLLNATGAHNDPDGWRLGGGIEYDPIKGLTSALEFTTFKGNEQTSDWSGMFTLRVTF